MDINEKLEVEHIVIKNNIKTSVLQKQLDGCDALIANFKDTHRDDVHPSVVSYITSCLTRAVARKREELAKTPLGQLQAAFNNNESPVHTLD